MTPPTTAYVGSQACRRCHAPTYERWSKTRMANVVRDPREHPDAVIPDFSKPDPARTISLSDVALVYGSKWKQRYFTKVGDDYFPLGAQWDVTHQQWRPYLVADGCQKPRFRFVGRVCSVQHRTKAGLVTLLSAEVPVEQHSGTAQDKEGQQPVAHQHESHNRHTCTRFLDAD